MPNALRTLLPLALVAVGCATPLPVLQRGAAGPTIHAELGRALTVEGYSCSDAPDKSHILCTHPKTTNINLAYLPASNLIQLFANFDRAGDESMAEKWRGDCSGVAKELNDLNTDLVLQTSCQDETVSFALSIWVPDNGFTDADVRGVAQMFTRVIAEALQGGGFVK